MPHEWRQAFQLLNRNIFIWRFKVSSNTASLKSLGSKFHVLEPLKEKDLSPNIFTFNLGVTNNFESYDNLRW